MADNGLQFPNDNVNYSLDINIDAQKARPLKDIYCAQHSSIEQHRGPGAGSSTTVEPELAYFVSASRVYFEILDLTKKICDRPFTSSSATDTELRLIALYYLLYRLFGTSLAKNPFLVHFVLVYDELRQHKGTRSMSSSITSIVRCILCQDYIGLDSMVLETAPQKLQQLQLGSSQQPNWPKLQGYLRAQSIDPGVIRTGDANPALFGPEPQLKPEVLVQNPLIPNTSPSTESTEPSTPFTSNDNPQFIYKLARTRATNSLVDAINGYVQQLSLDNRRLLLYEVVLFNLNLPTVSPKTVSLLCALLISLHDRNLLQPIDDYRSLFASFINWISTVPQAREVYLLS